MQNCRSYLLITRGIYNIPNIRICIRIRRSSCTDISICIRIRGSRSFDICMCIRFRESSCTIRIWIRIRGSRNFGIRYISRLHIFFIHIIFWITRENSHMFYIHFYILNISFLSSRIHTRISRVYILRNSSISMYIICRYTHPSRYKFIWSNIFYTRVGVK